MNIFLTGATGYIGGSVAEALRDAGHAVHGLVRSAEKVEALRARGVTPVVGTLDDAGVLRSAAGRADAVINTADSDHRGAVEALIDAVKGTGKALIHTSGSSVVCDDARGDYESPDVYEDDSPLVPVPMREARVAIDRLVRSAGVSLGVRGVVICPTMIYGPGRGLQKESDQVPKLTRESKERGVGLHVGRGLNRWSNVYIDDLVSLYLLALEKAPSASFFFAENGEESLGGVAASISRRLGFGGKTAAWPIGEAVAALGDWARFAIGSNSRVRAVNARRLLGWAPSGPSILESIEGDT